MVVDRNAFHTATNSALTNNWRVSIDHCLFRAFGRVFGGVGHAMDGLARVSVLPYAHCGSHLWSPA